MYVITKFFFYSSKKKSKPAPKRAPKATPSTSTTDTSGWLFGSEDSDSEQAQHASKQTVSVLSRRVPGGTLRRTARLDGDLLAELRLFNAEEVREVGGIERCDKAIVWLRLQGEAESSEFNLLKKFINLAKAKFITEGTFYADKKAKK